MSATGGLAKMKTFVEWIADHVLTTLLIAGSVYALGYVLANRIELFYKK
jgi:hypothetical protein